MKEKSSFLIAQISDVHCGDPRFDKKLMQKVIFEINSANPDLVIIPGDLTATGYRDQFEEAKSYFEQIKCPQQIVIAGNHDCRNVGYLHFEDVIGPRYHIKSFPFAVKHCEKLQEKIKLLAVDSNKPDLDDGEVGREKYSWITNEFAEKNIFKVFVLHHHLISIPGTGRERNIVWDAGDVLEKLEKARVDLVLAGHRHVPYVWPIAGMLIVTSGTATTWRTRGYTPPSYNLIEITPSKIKVTIKNSADEAKIKRVFPRNASR